ncbi:hypothetical protein [Paraburkholderia bonniea]|uniref:hypothetical protein n=1 Tax=Paraburkholderia bonniea TaxID=2152891 RepID=UPI00129115C3|nr:hypothetical protein [Paraburkholderia bonniea]
MANANSTEVTPDGFNPSDTFSHGYTRAKNLLRAIERLAGAYLDRTREEITSSAQYYASELHENMSVIFSLEVMLNEVVERELWFAFVALSISSGMPPTAGDSSE